MDEGALIVAFNAAHDRRNIAYEKSRFATDGNFTVKHFAGNVVYNVSGFLEKNNDSLFEDLLDLIYASSNEFIQNAILNVPHLSAFSSSSSSSKNELGFVEKIAENMMLPKETLISSTQSTAASSSL